MAHNMRGTNHIKKATKGRKGTKGRNNATRNRRHYTNGGGFIQSAMAPLVLWGMAQRFSKKSRSNTRRNTRKNKHVLRRSRK